jgi:hypothetical protein
VAQRHFSLRIGPHLGTEAFAVHLFVDIDTLTDRRHKSNLIFMNEWDPFDNPEKSFPKISSSRCSSGVFRNGVYNSNMQILHETHMRTLAS